MKRIVSNNNYVQLEEFNTYTNRYVLQLGFALSGLTYKIENRNVKFYLKEDYFYKNSVWSADIPLEIDGKTYTQENIADGLSALFGQTGGGVVGVVSVNNKTGIVKLTAEDVDAYTKEEVDDLINQINSEIDALEQTVNGHIQDIDTINSEIVAINGNVEVLEGKVTALETDNEANKTDIQNLKDSVSALRERVTALETAAANNLVASNIKSGKNISVSVSGNDVTISTVGIPTVEGLAELEEQVSANTTAIEGIQQEITGKEHFRGYFATNAEIHELTATNGDFAFSAESGTKWAYNNNVWTDTEKAVPDKTVEKSTTVPLMDGTATIGSSNKYAAADHIHPTDTTRASQSDLTALETQVQANTTAIGNKANQSDLNALSNGLSEKANSADLATVATSGSYNDLTNKPVIPVVDEALSDTSKNPVQNKVVNEAIGKKQDTISDLETIRSGAALGATAYQKPSTGIPASDIAEGVIPTVPTNVSAFTNDAGYLTQHQSLDNYYTKQEVNGLTSNFFDKAIYDSDNKAIIFKNGDDVIATIDATGFIKDGMVSNVEILESNLVITFNTDAGKEPISIALTNIFNPANYYNKTEVDGKLALKADASNVYTKEDADSKFLTEHQSLDNYYTKTQVNEALTLKQDANTAFSGDYNDLTNKPDLSVYAESADLATVATSGDYNDLTNKPTIPAAQVNADWDASSGVAQILNKPTNVSVFANDAGYLTEHQSLNNYYTKLEVDNQFTAIDKRMTDFDKGIDDLELIVSSSLNDLNARIEEISSDNTNQFTAINKRITDFDEGIDDLELIVSSSLNDINTRVETNLSTINSLLNKIDKLTQRVTALEGAKTSAE